MTHGLAVDGQVGVISTHTPLARRDGEGVGEVCRESEFLLTRLLRGVTGSWLRVVADGEISTHTPLARRDAFVTLRVTLF